MTDPLIKRVMMFLFGCMGARFALVAVAKYLPSDYLPLMAIPAFALAIGFAAIYAFGWRKTGIEVGGDVIWWNALRPVHAALWFTFGVLALARRADAWIVLLIDTLIGLFAFLTWHIVLKK